MSTPAAEIEAQLNAAKVDSDADGSLGDGSAPSGTETPAAKDPASPDSKRDAVNERFDKLTRDLYELRGERDRDRYDIQSRDERIKELEAQLAKPSQVATDTTSTLPTLESVGFDEAKYAAVLSQHFIKIAESRGEAAAEKALQKFQAQQSAQTTQGEWGKREADFIKSTPDYVDKVKNARTLPISKDLQSELMQMDDGPQLAYYLVENREKAALIAQLPLGAQLREIGRIQGELAAKKAANPVSKAPAPVPKVDGSAATGEKLEAEMTDKEWERAQERAARLKKKRA